MRRYLTFVWECFRISFVGDWRYHTWMMLLTVVALKCSHGARLDGHKLAVVAPNAVLSRMVRLYRRGSRIAGLPSEVRSFDTPAEATAWLDASG